MNLATNGDNFRCDMGATIAGAASVPQTPVMECFERLSAAQRENHNLIDQLAACLEVVLSPPAPTKDGPVPVPPAASPLCSGLNDLRDAAHSMNLRLRDLLDRLTL